MAKVLELQLQHQSFQWIFRVFSFTWLDLLAVQETLKSILQGQNSKASILWCSTFFRVHTWPIHDCFLSHPYMTTEKNIALTIQIFVDKVMSLFFNMLSSFVMTFLSRSKCVLILWLQSLSTVILEPKEKIYHRFHFFSIYYLPWSDGTGCHALSFLNVEF